MRPSAAVHDALATLLEYPREGHAVRCRAKAETVSAEIPEAAADLEPFVRLADAGDLGACEETYVRTFDVNSERALEVGWQVFGEQYARGAFLVRMRAWMREQGVEETAELPDHLTQVLRILGRVTEEQARLLIGAAVEPSLRRVRKDLGDDSPYAGVMDAVAKVVAWAGEALSMTAAAETAAMTAAAETAAMTAAAETAAMTAAAETAAMTAAVLSAPAQAHAPGEEQR